MSLTVQYPNRFSEFLHQLSILEAPDVASRAHVGNVAGYATRATFEEHLPESVKTAIGPIDPPQNYYLILKAIHDNIIPPVYPFGHRYTEYSPSMSQMISQTSQRILGFDSISSAKTV